MKTKAEILEILRKEKPELVRRYGLKRLALFGSYAREDQREDSDVDILVEIEPQIGLGFVELADRIEDALGIRTEVVSRRAIKPRYWERTWLMSRRAAPLLIEDMGDHPEGFA
jgi:predicted nucleotidyltransferase